MIVDLMTYNVRVGVETSIAALIEAIRAVGVPDVLALQEVGLRWRMGECVDQARAIATGIGLNHVAFAGALLDEPSGGRFGVALASRFPLDGVHTTNLPREHDEQRVILRARVCAPRPFVAINTHLSVKPAERLRQARQLALAVQAERDPVVLLGDLNDLPGSAPIEAAFAALTDCFDAGGVGSAETFSVARPHARIDYVGCGVGVTPLPGATVERAACASDHFPLRARVRIGPDAPA